MAVDGSDVGTEIEHAADPRHTPVVLLSRTTDEGEIDRFGREKARAILAPPFQLRSLRSAIRSVAKEYV